MASTKQEFYDSLVGRQLTISVLVTLHGISRPTVMKYLKKANIEPMPESWPPVYTLESPIVAPEAEKIDRTQKPRTIKEEHLTGYLHHLLDKETTVNIAEEFRKVDNHDASLRLIKGLEDTLEVARFYHTFFPKEGLI